MDEEHRGARAVHHPAIDRKPPTKRRLRAHRHVATSPRRGKRNGSLGMPAWFCRRRTSARAGARKGRRRAELRKKRRMAGKRETRKPAPALEARVGIEPAYADLQSAPESSIHAGFSAFPYVQTCYLSTATTRIPTWPRYFLDIGLRREMPRRRHSLSCAPQHENLPLVGRSKIVLDAGNNVPL